MSNTLPAMVNGKTRRPNSWMRADVPDADPRLDPHPDGKGTMARVAFFEYREDAVAAAREWCIGWDTHPQYVGRYDLWTLEAKRKSWGYRYASILVEACRDPEATVTRHAHVPITHSIDHVRPIAASPRDV